MLLDYESDRFWSKNPIVRPERQVYKYLKNRVGGLTNMNVNGAITPQLFEYVVPAEAGFYSFRLNFGFINSGMKPDNFAGLAALANGIKIEIRDSLDAVVLDYTDAIGIKSQADFAYLAGVDANITSGGGTPDSLAIRWTMALNGAPDYLDAGQKFVITVQDDLSTITQMRAMIQGITIDRSNP